jgi:hypothetical protein
MTRPIEKVERNPALQRFVLIFDIINVVIFIACGIWQQNILMGEAGNWLLFWYIMTCIFFFTTVFFYMLTVFMDPGYVETSNNFQ